jgi:hypothetical protein
MIPALINLIFYLLILGILVALVFWVLTQIPIPEPIARIIKVAIVVIVVLVIVLLLLQIVGGGGGISLPKIAS